MKNNKIIIALNEKIFLNFVKSFWIQSIKTWDFFLLWEIEKEENKISVFYWSDKTKIIQFILENYLNIFKIVIAWQSEEYLGIELNDSDIICPNTFTSESKETIFLEYAIWENFDLEKFKVSLSWICSDKKWEVQDVVCSQIFDYLEILKKEDLLEKTAVFINIWESSNYENLFNIVDLAL